MSEQVIPANWYADPDNPAQLRWWDGSAWTSHYSPLPSPIAEEPTEILPASGLKVFVPHGLLDRVADIAQGIEDKASDLRTTGSAMVSAAMAARNDKPEGDERITRVPPMPMGPPEASVEHTEARMPTTSIPDVPVPSANLGEVEYTTRTVRTFRAMEGRTRAKLEKEGWEFVARTDAPMLRSEITFRRVRKRVPRAVYIAGASVVAVAILAIVLGAVGEGQRTQSPASVSSGIVAATKPSAAAETPTPSPTPVPITHVIQDLSTLSGTDAVAALQAANISTVFKSTDGSTITDTTGWAFQSQDVPAGNSVAEGSTVTLTFAPPPPPPPAPVVAPPAPAVDDHGGATALCRDGTPSFAAHHQGACSHHGGVAVFYK